MSKSGERKFVGRFPSVMDADVACSFLESNGLEAEVESRHLGTIMPHATQAIGGIRISVAAEDEEQAKGLLASLPAIDLSEPLENKDRAVVNLMKRAAYGAMLGCIILPVISNLYSVFLFFQARKWNSDLFWEQKKLILIGVIFNLIGFMTAAYLIYAVFLS